MTPRAPLTTLSIQYSLSKKKQVTVEKICFHFALALGSVVDFREFKHARFSDEDGNRKRTCRVLGLNCHPSVILFISNGEKIRSNVNVVVRGQVKSETSSLAVAVRVSKTRVL